MAVMCLLGGRRRFRSTNQPGLRSGFQRIDAIVLVACAAVLFSLAIAQAGRINKIARKPVCAANIRGIIQCFFIYAQSNDSCFPTVVPPKGGHYENSPGNPLRAEGLAGKVIKAMFHHATTPLTRREKKEKPLVFKGIKARSAVHQGSPLACMWLLVLQNYSTAKSFICPADPFGTHPSAQFVANKENEAIFPSNFGLLYEGRHKPDKLGGPGQGESYSIAFPWKGSQCAGWWTDNDGSDVPIVSDMAPAMDIHEHGRHRQDYRDPAAPEHHPKYQWAFNTGNHDGAGQNVGFGDDHVSWNTTPYVGQNGDNIFTFDSPHQRHPAFGGGKVLKPGRASPCPTGQPAVAPYDIVMAPVRNVATGAW